MSRDNAPVGHTCNTINGAISLIESTITEAKYLLENPDENPEAEAKEIIRHMEESKPILEEIRTANEQLRGWGNEQHERADDAEAAIDALKSRVEELGQEVSNLESHIEELEEKYQEG
jgi:chromosome segregation ATPase